MQPRVGQPLIPRQENALNTPMQPRVGQQEVDKHLPTHSSKRLVVLPDQTQF